MAVRTSFTAGEVLAAADLTDTFASKLNLAGGKILQVVRATDSTERATTSLSSVDVTGMAVTITPLRNTSAILLIADSWVSIGNASTIATLFGEFRLTDSSNNVISGGISGFDARNLGGTSPYMAQRLQLIGYATPATTSAVTYKMRFSVSVSGLTITANANNTTGQLFAIEVSA